MSVYMSVKSYFAERRILLALILAVSIALAMTAVSLKLYDMDYVSRLDVSLPNRESLRSKAATDDEARTFGTSGPLDAQAYSDFQRIYTQNRDALNALGKFDSDVLSRGKLHVGGNE